jgi:hypothetical protein
LKVTTSVSGKTSFLVCGNFVGRSKWFAAREKKVRAIDEDGLFALVRAAPGPPEDEPMPEQQEQPAAAGAVKQEQQPAAAGEAAGPSSKLAKSFYGAGGAPPAAAAVAAAAAAGASGSSAPAPKRAPPAADQQLWVEKWRPKTSADLVGNQARHHCCCLLPAGAASVRPHDCCVRWCCGLCRSRHSRRLQGSECCRLCPALPALQTTVNTLKTWLRDWEKIHLHGGKPAPVSGGSAK